MNVRELYELIADMNPEAEIFVSSDEEGNSYRKANFSFPEKAIHQDGEWIIAAEPDIASGEYEGWEDEIVDAVVIW